MAKIAAIILVFFLSACTWTPYHDVPAQVLSWSQGNVYKLYSNTGIGSGFFINKTQLITACHVVNSTRQVRAVSYDSTKSLYLTVKSCNPSTDIAILEAREPQPGVRKTKLSHIKTPIGKSVWGAGYPLGSPLTITFGNWGYEGKFGQYLTVPTAGGDSGSPVLAMIMGRSTVVGMRVSITYYEYPDDKVDDVMHSVYFPHLSHAVSSSAILEFIGEAS